MGKFKGTKTRTNYGVVILVAFAIAVCVVIFVVRSVLYRAAPLEPLSQTSAISIQEPIMLAPRPIESVRFADGCLTSDCHGTMTQQKYVHQTFTEEACDLCHMPDTGGHVYPQIASTESTCTSCHDTGAGHLFQHKAMSEEACLACHDPHGSDSPMLLTAGTVEATCIRCHPNDRGPVAHEPYAKGQCVQCHDPHGADNAMLLVGGEGPDHCRKCHTPQIESIEAGSHTHLDVEGSCLGCHEAHSSLHEGLLPAQPRDLCISCHEEIGQTVDGATVSHDSVLTGDQCITCHDPHTSEHETMLRDTQTALCLGCHDGPLITTDNREIIAIGAELEAASMAHGAVSIGQCSECHSVHGGNHLHLLKSVMPTVFVGPFDAQNYALCFSCHDKNLLDSPGATFFRDGEMNLHSIHLRAHNKSGGCSDCHSVHAGNQPRLIVESVQYQGSEWAMPMNFEITAAGGRCAPGCHEPLSYDRRMDSARPQNNGDTP